MKARFRDSMTWLHTWVGVVAGGLLFAIFLTGTLAYFNNEISAWMQPEVQQYSSTVNAVDHAQSYLNEHASNSKRWTIMLPTDRFSPPTLYWRDPKIKGRGLKTAQLNENGEKITARNTRGGSFLYRFHFDLHYMPAFYARWLVGICAMFMLVGIISGIIIHKKIFKDFFTLQFNKGNKSWLNGHTVTSVLALPFHLMITYTGLVTLMFMYLSWSMSLAMNDSSDYFKAINGKSSIPKASGINKEMQPISQLYLNAKSQLGDSAFTFITINHPNDENASAVFTEGTTKYLIPEHRTLIYSASTGELIANNKITNTGELTRRTMISLHSGRFATSPVRWLYFISGVMGSIMIATGLILWSEKRKKSSLKKGSSFGHHLVDYLNIVFLLGLPIALAFFFTANRLLPLDLTERANMEVHCFFFGWLLTVLYALFRGVKRSWKELTLYAGALFLLLPVFSLITSPRHLLNYEIQHDLTLLIIEVLFILVGIMFTYVSSKIKKYPQGHSLKELTKKGSVNEQI
ncbi:PepSY-associated TM helix domain-containing protein [Pseudoalteromonas undina]|uniref:PepSY-associated TM helix domain-containing protein n=1 Tax=Pseudoalteromonas TaxID=53246 RepID=UPI001867B50E|nr:PepSY-associated TM helix domain-containing protein [Pseudoalteromonas undina]